MPTPPLLETARSLAGANWIGRAIRRATFDNREFWNTRYVTDPAKGSGPGSRGTNLQLKADLIRSTIEQYGIETVLDIGCGDIAVTSPVPIKNYIGIDISEVVVDRNRQLMPNWNFVCADLAGEYVPPNADLVLCLDVLIHQRSRRAYCAILSKALRAAGKVALVSGYSHPDPGWNVFFHEPLAKSVRHLCPAARIDLCPQYRETDLLSIRKLTSSSDGNALALLGEAEGFGG